MFALRGIAVSFSIFALLYVGLSSLVCVLWRKLLAYGQPYSAKRSADLLFFARLAPFAAASTITLALAVPSFLILEPRAADEGFSLIPVALGVCGVSVLLAGAWKYANALLQASRNIARWSREADAESDRGRGSHFPICVRRIAAHAPPLTAAGIFRPSVWLSRAAEFVLTERELQSAVRHEVAHVRRRDNLRKLILRFVAFPGMKQLECAWRELTEMAADDAAVTSACEALDLAAAVIKLSRLALPDVPTALTTSLVHSPAESVHARVDRLLAWSEGRERSQNTASKYSMILPMCAAAAALFTLAVTYGELLARVHTATEWLVR